MEAIKMRTIAQIKAVCGELQAKTSAAWDCRQNGSVTLVLWAAANRLQLATSPLQLCAVRAVKVGYAVRFDTLATRGTSLKFVTDGSLLREMMEDPLLTLYRWPAFFFRKPLF